MLIRDILSSKGSAVVTVSPTATVLEASRLLVQNAIGSLMVVEGGEIMGILTERDVLRLAAGRPALVESILVADAMTTDLVVGVPEDAVSYAMAVMTNNRVRHLPVLDGGRLVGIVSIGDLVNASLTTLEAENRWIRDYVQGTVGRG